MVFPIPDRSLSHHGPRLTETEAEWQPRSFTLIAGRQERHALTGGGASRRVIRVFCAFLEIADFFLDKLEKEGYDRAIYHRGV